MKEILFRGKRVDGYGWIDGYLFKIWDKAYILWGTTNDIPNMIQVDINTIGQFTGLTDKNGKKIFEGDIVQTKYGMLCVAEWSLTPCFCGFDLTVCVNWNDFGIAPSSWDLYMPQNLEIVGNIYDNPNLLNKE